MRPARLLVLVLVAVVAGCNGASGPAVDPRAGTAVIGALADVRGFNPYLAESAHTEDVLAILYPSLAVEQADFRDHPPSFAPWLARAWRFSDDQLTLTVELEPGARWSDGRAVTSADVVFTYTAQISPELAWPSAVIKDRISAVEAVDDHTVRYTFSRAYPYQLMDVNEGPILPAHVFGQVPFAEWATTDWSTRVVSAGAFRLERHVPNQELTLAADPGFWRGRPSLDRVVWRVVPDQDSLVNQLLAGEVDLVTAVPPTRVREIEASPRLRLVSFPDRGYTHISWNTRRPVLADPRVRRALTHAVDRAAIIATIYQGFARPSLGPVLSDMWAFNHALAPLAHSPEQARALLAEAGFIDADGDGVRERAGLPLAIELLAPAENRTRQDVAVLVQADLARVGVKVTTRTLEWGTLLQRLDDGDFDGVVHRWIEPTQVDLAEVWHSPPPDEGSLNYGGYANPEVDRLLAAVDEAVDAAAQKPLLDRIQELIVADQPYTFLAESVRLDGVSRRLAGCEINEATPYFNLHQWRIVPAPE